MQVRPTWEAEHQAFTVSSSALPFFVNSNEWHLDASVAAAGRSKILHLVVYVPAAHECPLHFKLPSGKLSPTDGFTVPSWGGVVVWNPPNCSRCAYRRSLGLPGPHSEIVALRLASWAVTHFSIYLLSWLAIEPETISSNISTRKRS
jgi:hypothetical protein